MRKLPNTARLFADVYDGGKQGVNVGWDDLAGRSNYLARFRLDTFLHQQIVVSDADVLDGTFFLDAATNSFLNELPLAQLEIRARSANFENSILASFRSPGEASLRRYFFSSMPNDLANEVHAQLGTYPSSGIDSWRKIPRVLRDVGLAPEMVDRYEAAWAAWIEITNQGLVRLVPWNTSFRFTDRFMERIAKDAKSARDTLLTPVGIGAMEMVLKQKDSRNDVHAIVSKAKAESSFNLDEDADLATVIDWYDSVYNRTRAESHDCTPETTFSPQTHSFNKELMFLDQIRNSPLDGTGSSADLIKIPDTLVDALARVDPKWYATLLGQSVIANHLDDWFEYRSFSSLRRAVELLVNSVDNEVGIGDESQLSNSVIPAVRLIAAEASKVGEQLGERIGGLFMMPSVGKSYGSLAGSAIGIGAKGTASVLTYHATEKKRERVIRSIIEIAKTRSDQSATEST